VKLYIIVLPPKWQNKRRMEEHNVWQDKWPLLYAHVTSVPFYCVALSGILEVNSSPGTCVSSLAHFREYVKQKIWLCSFFCLNTSSQDSSVRVQWLGNGLGDCLNPERGNKIFSLCYWVQTGSLAHPSSYPVGITTLSPGVVQLVCEADHSRLSSAEVKNAWNCTSTPLVHLHSMVFFFFFLC
jgi:hypothetical protein